MPTSLVKFSHQTTKNGKQLLWGRADEDGFPFRSVNAPLMTEDEYEARAVKVKDFCWAFFDVAVAEEGARYSEIMDRCANGWYHLHHLERFWRETTKHYIEWFECFMEDGTRTPASQHAILNMGQANGLAHGSQSLD